MIRFRGFEVSGECETHQAHSYCNELTYPVIQKVPYAHRDRVKMAYMELLANAIQASEKHGGETIRIDWRLDYGLLTLKISNEGVEFTPTTRHFVMPDVHAERGRGLPLTILLTDGIHFHLEDGRTVVSAYWEFDQIVYGEVA